MDNVESSSSASASSHTSSSISRPSSSSSAAQPSPTTNGVPASAPISPLFEVRQTPNAGRAVFATRAIPRDTPILRSDDLTLSVLLREYRREVCGQCFTYEHGRDLSIRDKDVGFAFCTPTCHASWQTSQGALGISAWTAVETLIKPRSKEDSAMVDANLPRPDLAAISTAWAQADTQATLIRHARLDPPTATKQHRKALTRALQARISPDTLAFCLSGLLWHYARPSALPTLLALAADPTPYHSSDDLESFTRTYLHLLSILPTPLLPTLTPALLRALSTHDSHNAFGIRSLEDEGSEFFGYGCWPSASYFNHSCALNVGKKRVGRAWEFVAERDVREGEELSITYLSGEERSMSWGNRVALLKKNWGFECGCARCSAESLQSVASN